MAFALNRRRSDFSSTRTLFVKISHFYFLCRDGMSSQAMSSGAVDLSDGGHRQKKWSVMSGFEFRIRHNVNSHNGFPRTRRAKTRRRLERRTQPLCCVLWTVEKHLSPSCRHVCISLELFYWWSFKTGCGAAFAVRQFGRYTYLLSCSVSQSKIIPTCFTKWTQKII